MESGTTGRRGAAWLLGIAVAGLAGLTASTGGAAARDPRPARTAPEPLPLPPPEPPPSEGPGGPPQVPAAAPAQPEPSVAPPEPVAPTKPPEPPPPADWSARVRVERVSRGEVVRLLSESQVGVPAGHPVPLRIVDRVPASGAPGAGNGEDTVEVGWSLILRADPVGPGVLALRYEFSEVEIESVRRTAVGGVDAALPTMKRRALSGMALLRTGEAVPLRESLALDGFLTRTTVELVALPPRQGR